MSLSTTTSKIMYTGNGATTQWDIPFPFLDKNDLQVYRIGTDGISTLLTGDYQINETTRVLTYPLQTNGVEPLAVGEKLLILRHTPRTQSVQLAAQATLDASVLESGYDKAMMVCQELEEKLERCLQMASGSPQTNTNMQSYVARMEELLAQATGALEDAQNLEQSLTEMQESVALAQAWATKTDGTVDGEEYSAKQYALQAANTSTNKADISLSNITNEGKTTASAWPMPSDTYIDLTLGTSGTSYTAPANGWFSLNKACAVGQSVSLNNTSKNMQTRCQSSVATASAVYLPVMKNDQVVVLYDANGNTNVFRFIYAEGNKSEAN